MLFFKTTVSFDVLSEEPIEDLELESIVYGMNNGSLVGGPIQHEKVELTGKEMAKALSDFGSEPGFFQLNDEGEIDGE